MTESQPTGTPDTNGVPLSTATIVSVCVLVALVLGGVVTLTLFNRPVDTVLILVASIIAPTIAALLASKKLDSAKSILHDVSIKVNGRLDGALNAIAALEDQVRATGETPVTRSPLVPAPRHSAENPPASTVQDNNNG